MLKNPMQAFVRCLLAAAIAVVALLPLAAAPDAPRVLLISVDGLMPSSYTDPAFAARTPNLRRLAQEGVCGRRRHRRHADRHLSLAHHADHRRRAGPPRHLRQPHPRSGEPLERRVVLVRARHPGADAAGCGAGPRPDRRRRDVAGVRRDGPRLQRAGVHGHVAPPGRHPAPARPEHAADALRCGGAGPGHAVRVAADRSRSHRPHQLHPAHLRAEPDDAAPDRARLGAAHLRAGIPGGARGDGADGPLRRRTGGGGAQGAGRREDDRRDRQRSRVPAADDAAPAERRAQGGRADRRQRIRRRQRLARLESFGRWFGLRLRQGRGRPAEGGGAARDAAEGSGQRHPRRVDRGGSGQGRRSPRRPVRHRHGRRVLHRQRPRHAAQAVDVEGRPWLRAGSEGLARVADPRRAGGDTARLPRHRPAHAGRADAGGDPRRHARSAGGGADSAGRTR